ncbi:lipocalin family protein [Empedobacter falsenii]
MKKLIFILTLFLANIAFSQELKKENVLGFWKLKEAGFYEAGKKISKYFDNCRLMRNYTIWDNGYAIYNYVEGRNGNCFPSEPRLTLWRIVENRIQFYIDDYVFEDKIVKVNEDNSITFETFTEKKIMDSDKNYEKIANTISYDILEKL